VTAKLVLATRNAHKVAELGAILADADPRLSADLLIETVVGIERFEVADVVESGVTFEANALLKARAAAQATGLPAVADDSGLCVDVLGSAPGVFSARWAGRHGADDANLRLLLDQLADVPDEHRGAAFVCAIALVHPDGRTIVEHGRLPGVLTRAPRGAGGFGYDPILQVPDGRTCAQLSAAEKNAVSHRGRAVRAIAPEVAQILLG
jgi:XTP/dITP diphosphohydrolase